MRVAISLRVVRQPLAHGRWQDVASIIRSVRARDLFSFRRQIPAQRFADFFLFEQLLPVGTYMADSRSQSLTYVTVGDPDLAEHDWNYTCLASRGSRPRHTDRRSGQGFSEWLECSPWWLADVAGLVPPNGVGRRVLDKRCLSSPALAIWDSTSNKPPSQGSGSGSIWNRPARRKGVQRFQPKGTSSVHSAIWTWRCRPISRCGSGARSATLVHQRLR